MIPEGTDCRLYLETRGWKLTGVNTWTKPEPDYDPTYDEWEAIWWLHDHAGYGTIEPGSLLA